MDLALLSVLRDGLLRRSEAAALTWGDVELRDNGTALINVRRSKTDQEGEGITLYIGSQAAQALAAIRPSQDLLDSAKPIFGLSTRQIGRRVSAAAKAAGLGGCQYKLFRWSMGEYGWQRTWWRVARAQADV